MTGAKMACDLGGWKRPLPAAHWPQSTQTESVYTVECYTATKKRMGCCCVVLA